MLDRFDPMEFKLPLASGTSDSSSASGGKMAQSPAAPSSPANYDFLMRRASAVYEAQFEVSVMILLYYLYLACNAVCSKNPQQCATTAVQSVNFRRGIRHPSCVIGDSYVCCDELLKQRASADPL